MTTRTVILSLNRHDRGLVRVVIVSTERGDFAQIEGVDSSGETGPKIGLRPDQLRTFASAILECAALLLGAPDPRAEAARVQAAAGLGSRDRRR